MKSLPNILSTLRIVLAPVFLLLYLEGGLIWGGLSILVFTIAAITDYFDGHYARKYDIESSLGVFLDPLADKVLTFSAFIVLPFIDPAQFPWWAVILIIIRDVFMTGLRVYANKKDMQMKTRSFAKTKTTIQLTFLYIALLLGVFEGTGNILADWSELVLSTGVMFWLMMLVTFITVYSGIEYIFTNKKLFKSSASS
ncbi:MAG TPA: CDP-diacylglycerol--glycerol-3-phosphate 3-phosphatidyltransferase [Balneola sp.]|nr:CDP-diacylglycerol--glycerol-3-phosphate 3-phosphatidyltransferase [Balneola sp.]MAO78420.1 CDP-diacylglycerol--glycerol-3-phosphate 3-phosphatidyltransferase [Balneola sp.]MBF64420.1 CDP-diacylglycerol--glycerol-3-phosphate 3-phosphatidyltransferase [Balneola sp.]HAH50910.1 CDP-diacylglycerol--glycerol-3-phosphate 3-phosphatidyltransferase [Balneola sp.]HAW80390.1 CDP-diacylglycerol--glycerol-3-phosphate 3-phosphatidyltransferase [Balneola sp.]|tara:strand:+ start:35431 stop:36021 length:591 start_codon:yes stop_codon:yes gene_type:complete